MTDTTTTPKPPLTNIEALRLMVRGAYDLQGLRMQVGLRLVANFRSKLTDQPAEEEGKPDEMSPEAKKIIDQLKASYKRLTDGIVVRNKILPAEKDFKGDELISSFAELTLIDQYVRLEAQEGLHFRQMHAVLHKMPIYTEYLMHQRGVGHAMAGVLITYFDPHSAAHVSSFWKYCGLDVVNGAGRSRRREHLVEREYITKSGTKAKRMSVTYNPFLKTKMAGVLGPSFMLSSSPWRDHYDRYKHRLETDPNRNRIGVEAWKKIYAQRKKEKKARTDEEMTLADMAEFWPPGRIHAASNRYMVKMFLADFWATWRRLEGLPVTPTYHEGVMGHVHHTESDPDSPQDEAAE